MEPKDYYYKDFRTDFAEFMAKSKMAHQHPGEGVYIPIQDLNENTMSHVKTDSCHTMRFLYCLAFTILIDQVMYAHFKEDYSTFQKMTTYPKMQDGWINVNPWMVFHQNVRLPRNLYEGEVVDKFTEFSQFFIDDLKEFFEKQNLHNANCGKVKEVMLNDKDVCSGSFGQIFCDKLNTV